MEQLDAAVAASFETAAFLIISMTCRIVGNPEK